MNGNIKLITGDSVDRINPTFNGVIGQEASLAQLKFFLQTHDSKTPIPTFLLTGSHGLGKTYVAEKFANAMGRRFVDVNCGSLKTNEIFIENILLERVVGETPCTLFLDESHELDCKITTGLLTLLNPSGNIQKSIHHKNWNIIFDTSKINVIFATTDAYRMFNPLLNRCERIYFESYNQKEILKMLEMYAPSVSFQCNETELAHACRGRGRDVVKLADKINRYMRMYNASIFNEDSWQNLKSIFEIQPLGLNRQELDMLKIISDNKAISVSNIALAMMINSENVESELEVRPRELGLIKSTSRGRVLTDKGLEYMKGTV